MAQCNGNCQPEAGCQWCDMSITEQKQQKQQDYDDNSGWGARMWNPPRKVVNDDKPSS